MRRSANYRWAAPAVLVGIGVMLVLAAHSAAATPAGSGAGAEPPARMTIALLPGATGVQELGKVRGLALGLLSPGLGRVPAGQTYLDIGQGARIWGSLYDRGLPPLAVAGGRVRGWSDVTDRAAGAPADVVPGLLASSLGAGFEVGAEPSAGALIAADRSGRVMRPSRGSCAAGCRGRLVVRAARPGELPRLVAALRGRDLLIALARPPARARRLLPVGIAGAGFEGLLDSESTRLRGLVLSTDLAPTILARLGLPAPESMEGEAITAGGDRDVAALGRLGDRLAEVAPRRAPVIAAGVLAWVALAVAASTVFGPPARRAALPLLALSAVYLPALLLLGAALEPSEAAERLLVLVGAPVLALGTRRLFKPDAALALACAATGLAYGADLIAGSPLTALSLMGPNPALGARFYGIGNELEATLAVLVLAGTGAGLAAAGLTEGRRPAIWFAVVGALAAVVLAAGRFGADVGAAVVLPVGAAVAALAVLGPRRPRRALLAVVAAPAGALAVLASFDLLLGGDAHLSRSVLDAGGLAEVADVAERRLRLSARSFARPANTAFLVASVGLIGLGAWRRRTLAGWFAGRPAALAGFLGAAAATAAGTLANDSGALVLAIGTGYLTAIALYAWAESPGEERA